MRTIYKFTLNLGLTELQMPKDAKPLHVAEWNGHLRLWVDMDNAAEKITRCFDVFNTGHDLGASGPDIEYVGTALMFKGDILVHVYECS